MQLYSVLLALYGEMLSVVSELLTARVGLTVVGLSRYVYVDVRSAIATNILRFIKSVIMIL